MIKVGKEKWRKHMDESERLAAIVAAVRAGYKYRWSVATQLGISENAARVYLRKAAEAELIEASPAIDVQYCGAAERTFHPLRGEGDAEPDAD